MNKKRIEELSPEGKLRALLGILLQAGCSSGQEETAIALAFGDISPSWLAGFQSGGSPDVQAPDDEMSRINWKAGVRVFRHCSQLADEVLDTPAPAEPEPETPMSRLDRLIAEAPEDLLVLEVQEIKASLSRLSARVAREAAARVSLENRCKGL